MIRQRNMDPEGAPGLWLFHSQMSEAVANVDDSAGIVLADVEKVDLVELGIWVATLSGGTPNLGVALYTAGDATYGGAATEIQNGTLATAAKQVKVDKFTDVSVIPDYSAASTNVATTGFSRTGGVMKLALIPIGDATAFTANVWALLRVWKRKDL